MSAIEASQQNFLKAAARGFHTRPSLTTRGLVLGAGTLVAKFDRENDFLGDEERAATLLAVAFGDAPPEAIAEPLQRVAKHWRSGHKCLAAIHLAQSRLPEIDLDAAYRLSLAAELIDAGVTPLWLAEELGVSPVQLDISKYDENQPRLPAGSGRASGRWTSGAGGGSAAADEDSGDASGSTRLRAMPQDLRSSKEGRREPTPASLI